MFGYKLQNDPNYNLETSVFRPTKLKIRCSETSKVICFKTEADAGLVAVVCNEDRHTEVLKWTHSA